MTTSSAVHTASTTPPHKPGAAGWLALAASPAFALMAWLAANAAPPLAFCTTNATILPSNSMTAMYLLMSLFHLSPWLQLAATRTGART